MVADSQSSTRRQARARVRQQGRDLTRARRASADCAAISRTRPRRTGRRSSAGRRWRHHLGAVDGSSSRHSAVYAEKASEGGMALRRGYDRLVAGKRVVVVEDILNTGGSIRDAIAAVRGGGRDGRGGGGAREPRRRLGCGRGRAGAGGAPRRRSRGGGRGGLSALPRPRAREHRRRQGVASSWRSAGVSPRGHGWHRPVSGV